MHEALRTTIPDVAELADRELPSFLAGCVAPDALRYFSDLGKFGTHFYKEDRKETWGRSVSGMFDAHPDLSDPGSLREREVAVILGYISHLTVDESFRDVVTRQVHGTEDWRPVIKGLWSLVDEIELTLDDLPSHLSEYAGDEDIGFVEGKMVREFLDLVGPWAQTSDPWESEKVFLKLVHDTRPEDEARAIWLENRERALPYLDESRFETFIDKAIETGLEEVQAYVNGGYCKLSCS